MSHPCWQPYNRDRVCDDEQCLCGDAGWARLIRRGLGVLTHTWNDSDRLQRTFYAEKRRGKITLKQRCASDLTDMLQIGDVGGL